MSSLRSSDRKRSASGVNVPSKRSASDANALDTLMPKLCEHLSPHRKMWLIVGGIDLRLHQRVKALPIAYPFDRLNISFVGSTDGLGNTVTDAAVEISVDESYRVVSTFVLLLADGVTAIKWSTDDLMPSAVTSLFAELASTRIGGTDNRRVIVSFLSKGSVISDGVDYIPWAPYFVSKTSEYPHFAAAIAQTQYKMSVFKMGTQFTTGGHKKCMHIACREVPTKFYALKKEYTVTGELVEGPYCDVSIRYFCQEHSNRRRIRGDDSNSNMVEIPQKYVKLKATI